MTTLTDLELTKRCAERMGYGQIGATPDGRIEVAAVGDNYVRRDDLMLDKPIIYDPLHDDAQAMALVKKFNVGWDKEGDGPWHVALRDDDAMWFAHDHNLNRAIVTCVANLPD